MHTEEKSPAAHEAALCTARWTSATPRAAIDAALKAAAAAGGDSAAAAKVLREVIESVSASQCARVTPSRLGLTREERRGAFPVGARQPLDAASGGDARGRGTLRPLTVGVPAGADGTRPRN